MQCAASQWHGVLWLNSGLAVWGVMVARPQWVLSLEPNTHSSVLSLVNLHTLSMGQKNLKLRGLIGPLQIPLSWLRTILMLSVDKQNASRWLQNALSCFPGKKHPVVIIWINSLLHFSIVRIPSNWPHSVLWNSCSGLCGCLVCSSETSSARSHFELLTF